MYSLSIAPCRFREACLRPRPFPRMVWSGDLETLAGRYFGRRRASPCTLLALRRKWTPLHADTIRRPLCRLPGAEVQGWGEKTDEGVWTTPPESSEPPPRPDPTRPGCCGASRGGSTREPTPLPTPPSFQSDRRPSSALNG